MSSFLKYGLRNSVTQFGVNGKVSIENPNSILFKNTGQVTAFINQFPLAPGDSLTSNLLIPEMVDQTLYQITFDPNGVGISQVFVISSKVYEIKNNPEDGAVC